MKAIILLLKKCTDFIKIDKKINKRVIMEFTLFCLIYDKDFMNIKQYT